MPPRRMRFTPSNEDRCCLSWAVVGAHLHTIVGGAAYACDAVSSHCHTCDEVLEDDARFCGMCGANLVDKNFGRVFGNRYVVRQRIGSGSLGAVYRAEQQGSGRKLAIK